eukprot:scaffold105978_cov42-Prasinocladus_malaysianus.AAC.1
MFSAVASVDPDPADLRVPGRIICVAYPPGLNPPENRQIADTRTTLPTTSLLVAAGTGCKSQPHWVEEVAKHTEPGSLRTVVYQGQAQWESYREGLSGEVVTPGALAGADLVLTTYE